jgi:hypothetical protein
VTTREAWRKRLADRTPEELETARKTYQTVIDLHEKFPELGSEELKENAVTVLREIERRLRK